MQRVMTSALFRPLTSQWGMQKRWIDGGPMKALASEFIKPNDRLSSFERLEIYIGNIGFGYWTASMTTILDSAP
jgi:hypothetical protein